MTNGPDRPGFHNITGTMTVTVKVTRLWYRVVTPKRKRVESPFSRCMDVAQIKEARKQGEGINNERSMVVRYWQSILYRGNDREVSLCGLKCRWLAQK